MDISHLVTQANRGLDVGLDNTTLRFLIGYIKNLEDLASETFMYATSKPIKYRRIQDNLAIDLFAKKHNLTIEQVEFALELPAEKRKEYLKQIKR